MKLGSATKLDKRNTALSKTFDDDLASANYDVMVIFFQFMVDLEQSGTQIVDVWSMILTFSLIETSYLTEGENRTKNL